VRRERSSVAAPSAKKQNVPRRTRFAMNVFHVEHFFSSGTVDVAAYSSQNFLRRCAVRDRIRKYDPFHVEHLIRATFFAKETLNFSSYAETARRTGPCEKIVAMKKPARKGLFEAYCLPGRNHRAAFCRRRRIVPVFSQNKTGRPRRSVPFVFLRSAFFAAGLIFLILRKR